VAARPRLERFRLLQGIAIAVVAAVAILASLILAPPADAHAYFQASSPAPGKRIEHSPRRVTLEFTEDLNQSLTKATIVSLATGKAIAAEPLPSPARELILKPAAPLPTAPSVVGTASRTLGSQWRAFEKSAMYANASAGESADSIVVT